MVKDPIGKVCSFILLICAVLFFISNSGYAADNQPIKIGVILPMSGSLAAYGKGTLDGIKMKTDQINAAGGIAGRKIELITENNEGETTKSSMALKKLIGLNKVAAVVGPITSRNALAVTREAQRRGIVLMTPTATNDAVTKDGDFIFRACFIDSFQGRAVAKFAIEDLKIRSAVAFQDTTSDYSVGLCKNFSDTFKQLGGNLLPMLSYKQGDTDFTAQLRKVRESNAQAIFIPGYPPEVPLIVNQAKQLGLKVALLGADGWDNEDVAKNAGKNLVGSYFVAAFSPQNPSPQVVAFLQEAKAKGIKDPRTFEALGYDAMGLVIEAAKRAGQESMDDLQAYRKTIRDAMVTIKDYRGASGNITMQPSGDPLKSLVIMKYGETGGKLGGEFVKAVNP